MTDEELSSHGLKYVYSHFIEMIETPFIWNELEATDDQIAELKEMEFPGIVASEERYGVRLRALLADETSLPKFVTDILTEHQSNWFRQMEFQILTGQYESSVSLLHPDLIEKLQLSERQIADIAFLADEYTANAKKLVDKIKNERKQIQSDFVKQSEALLSDQQKKVYQKLIGKSSKSKRRQP